MTNEAAGSLTAQQWDLAHPSWQPPIGLEIAWDSNQLPLICDDTLKQPLLAVLRESKKRGIKWKQGVILKLADANGLA